MSPYRTPATKDASEPASADEDRCPDADLAPVLFVFWAASVARVAIAVVLAPYSSRGAVAWWIRR